MLPLPPARTPRPRAERMLIARVVLAVGLALLMVVGAWSTSHGSADAHTTLCLAPGVSASTAPPTGDDTAGAAVGTDTLATVAAVCTVAILCVVALVLLFRRFLDRTGPVFMSRLPRATPSRAGPRSFRPVLSLTQLSISRT